MAEGEVLRWSAYEHEFVERGSDWFWALGIVAACIAVVAILMSNALFAILVILAAAIIGMLANVPPERTEFEVSERGIRVGHELHRFDEILAFWVEEEKDAQPTLLVDTVKMMAPNLIIPIEGVSPGAIRNFLREHTSEVPMKKPMAHKVLEFFGF